MKELKLTVGAGENFTANSLMLRYAALHSAVEFEHLPYFETGLKIGNDLYKYDHWRIEPDNNGSETVTLFMRKVEKELFRWSMDCSWNEIDYKRNISVLAEFLLDAEQMAKEAFCEFCGAPLEEIEISNVCREKADLGLELYRAAKELHGYEKAAKFIQMGADVNYRYLPDEFNSTPLHMAAYHADLLMMELLVEAGCDVNAVDIDGATPLDRAIARHNYPTVVDYLVEKGAMRGLDVVLHNARHRSEETLGHTSVKQEMEMV